ncbi:MAG: efflux RND transporter periplasmic adaptor subunit [Acidobacteriota bacterium]|nr:efflux RND transporter periplasmic adaptor subunit [Acidobacteriota bacterium]
MNEEKDLNLPTEENEIVSEAAVVEEIKRTDFRRRLAQPRFIALSILGLVLVIFAVIYLISKRNSQEGQPVPAPRTVSFGQTDANADGTADLSKEQTLTIPPEQIEQIKVEIETVGETLSSEVAGAASTGVVQANQYAETPVISLVGGVVRNVSAELGEYVRKGETVAVVFSDELAKSQSNYLAMVAESDEAGKRYNRALELSDVSQESRTELDRATAAFEIARAENKEQLSNYKRTEKLLEIGAASRQEFETVRAKYETAQAKLDEAKKRLERADQLLKINPERKNEIDRSLTQLRTMEAKTDAERQNLLVLGLSPEKINQIKQTRRVSSDLPIQSPVSGTVTMREVNSGEVVAANKELFKVTDLGTVWVIAEVYEKDLPKIRTGSGATVTSDAFPGRVFRGQVTYIDPNFNPTTRTAQARVELENPNQIFKVGQYVNVAFGSLGMAERTAPVVPSAAVQTINNQKVVFLTTDKPGIFVMRQIRLGAETENRYVVLEGVNVGDKIVASGSFLLRAEWIKQHPAN